MSSLVITLLVISKNKQKLTLCNIQCLMNLLFFFVIKLKFKQLIISFKNFPSFQSLVKFFFLKNNSKMPTIFQSHRRNFSLLNHRLIKNSIPYKGTKWCHDKHDFQMFMRKAEEKRYKKTSFSFNRMLSFIAY